ncbi:MAG TPA: hypothetical protein VED37_20285 [Ktedonobacteraceae bacterium]|nr:hypothetical protein [Ktedonobacteraceae bacterium]
MSVRNQDKKGRILTIEHPTDSTPALMVLSGNAGQLLRGDMPTVNILKAMRQRAHRNGVPFVLHFQEAGAVRKNSVGMTRLLEDVFGDEVNIFQYGSLESNGLIREGLDQYTVSSKKLAVRARSVVHLPIVERNVMRKNQRAAVNTSYDFVLPDGRQAYLETTGFHYDLGLTPISKRVSRLQAYETRLGVEKLIQQDINPLQKGLAKRSEKSQKVLTSICGREGLITFSGDGNTRGFVGTRWQMDRVDALKKGLGEDVQEATEEISVTANLPHSIQQEFIGKKHPLVRFAGNMLDDVFDAIDDTTGSKWGERKLDHQFFRDFRVTSSGKIVSLHRFDVIENNVFYDFANADHYCIGTLFGFQMNGNE